MNIVYAAIFHPAEEGGFFVSFPDLEGCFTEGNDLAHAIEMATEVLGVYVSCLMDDDIPYNPPTPIEKLDSGDGFLTYISANPYQYLEKKARSVKKTLTIPAWLNKEAEKAGINFSQTLKKALELTLSK